MFIIYKDQIKKYYCTVIALLILIIFIEYYLFGLLTYLDLGIKFKFFNLDYYEQYSKNNFNINYYGLLYNLLLIFLLICYYFKNKIEDISINLNDCKILFWLSICLYASKKIIYNIYYGVDVIQKDYLFNYFSYYTSQNYISAISVVTGIIYFIHKNKKSKIDIIYLGIPMILLILAMIGSSKYYTTVIAFSALTSFLTYKFKIRYFLYLFIFLVVIAYPFHNFTKSLYLSSSLNYSQSEKYSINYSQHQKIIKLRADNLVSEYHFYGLPMFLFVKTSEIFLRINQSHVLNMIAKMPIDDNVCQNYYYIQGNMLGHNIGIIDQEDVATGIDPTLVGSNFILLKCFTINNFKEKFISIILFLYPFIHLYILINLLTYKDGGIFIIASLPYLIISSIYMNNSWNFNIFTTDFRFFSLLIILYIGSNIIKRLNGVSKCPKQVS